MCHCVTNSPKCIRQNIERFFRGQSSHRRLQTKKRKTMFIRNTKQTKIYLRIKLILSISHYLLLQTIVFGHIQGVAHVKISRKNILHFDMRGFLTELWHLEGGR